MTIAPSAAGTELSQWTVLRGPKARGTARWRPCGGVIDAFIGAAHTEGRRVLIVDDGGLLARGCGGAQAACRADAAIELTVSGMKRKAAAAPDHDPGPVDAGLPSVQMKSSKMPAVPVEDEMARGRFANVRREGDAVVRHPNVKNSGSRALLRHFEAQGCSLTPRMLEESEQHERLSYIPGVTGYPPLSGALRSDEALVSVARAARTIHDLSVSFAAREAYEWHPLETCRPVRDLEIVGHGDLAPWNMVFDGTDVTGIIDWDAAGPMTRSWDVAYLAVQFVPFHLGDDISGWGWDTPPDRRARLALLCDAYGGLDPQDVVDDAILRLQSIGMFLRQHIKAGDPQFEVQRRERHDRGFMAAAANLAAHRDSLLDPESR